MAHSPSRATRTAAETTQREADAGESEHSGDRGGRTSHNSAVDGRGFTLGIVLLAVVVVLSTVMTVVQGGGF